jgi:SWI/SNF-related matrix-associated actin-dependent regulator 1 of chromatin subfamily A
MKKYRFDYSPRTKPFPHQVEAIEYLKGKVSVPLFDEQGLGKTKIVIEALCSNMERGMIDGALIICKKHLIEMWKDEIETHSHLKYIVLRGSRNEKGMRFMGYAQFYIINYESVIGEVNRLRMFLGVRRMAIVLDESHRIKNPNAKTTQAIMELREYARKRIIVTGTPIANRPIDLWAQFYFLDGGELLGTSYQDFKKRYDVNLQQNHLNDEGTRFHALRSLILSQSIRRLKDGVLELPEKRYFDKYVSLEGDQRKLYDQLRQKLFIEITGIDGKEIVDRSDEILKKLIRLAQIASNPFLIDKSYSETPIKFTQLDVLLEEIFGRGEKAIVWSCFVENIRVLYRRYRQYGALMLYGDLPIDKRNAVVRQFMSNGEIKMLIANPAVAKEGLTLTSANNAIYLDRNFNLVDYLQSQDRIHRISQTKECNIYKIVALGTIDEYIDDIIYKKQSLAGYIQGDADNIKLEKRFLSKEEILDVLGQKTR